MTIGTKSQNLVIMVVDICNYTNLTSKMGREEILHLQKKFYSLISAAVSPFDGRIIKNIGDAYLITFLSSTNSLKSGEKILSNLKQFNGENQNYELKIRLALNVGEVVISERGDDIFGDAVNLVFRIEKVANPNEIVFTEALRLTMVQNAVPYEFVGEKNFKGISEAIKLYVVMSEERFKHYVMEEDNSYGFIVKKWFKKFVSKWFGKRSFFSIVRRWINRFVSWVRRFISR
ncbi:MAG: adenylate/guanylate cyclase domain-containing protein [Elusimicrobia bacterium]|nr:adenylate/guanylate cyclase domain-containing protein [Candidatus Obscuribacterium magneticum]